MAGKKARLALVLAVLVGATVWVASQQRVPDAPAAADAGSANPAGIERHTTSPREAVGARVEQRWERPGRKRGGPSTGGAAVPPMSASERLRRQFEALAKTEAGARFLESQRVKLRVQLDELRAEHEAAGSVEERAEVMDRFSMPHQLLLKYRGGDTYLPFLSDVAKNGLSEDERNYAVIAVHGASSFKAVSFFIDLMKSDEPYVRFYSADGLAWVSGRETSRARRYMSRALNDEFADVREIAALSLGVAGGGGQTNYLAPLITRLRIEEEPDVQRAIVHAALKVDPERAKDGVREVALSLGGDRQTALESMLTSKRSSGDGVRR
jgi:hypothetical protein